MKFTFFNFILLFSLGFAETNNFFIERINLIRLNEKLNVLIEILMNISYTVSNSEIINYNPKKIYSIGEKIKDVLKTYELDKSPHFAADIKNTVDTIVEKEDLLYLNKFLDYICSVLNKKIETYSIKFKREKPFAKNSILANRIVYKLKYIERNIDNLISSRKIEIYSVAPNIFETSAESFIFKYKIQYICLILLWILGIFYKKMNKTKKLNL